MWVSARLRPHSRLHLALFLACHPAAGHSAARATRHALPALPALQYQPMLRQLEHTTWLATSAGQQPGDSTFSREQWDWALSVSVHAALRCAVLCMLWWALPARLVH